MDVESLHVMYNFYALSHDVASFGVNNYGLLQGRGPWATIVSSLTCVGTIKNLSGPYWWSLSWWVLCTASTGLVKLQNEKIIIWAEVLQNQYLHCNVHTLLDSMCF